jgi:hypothetical protein
MSSREFWKILIFCSWFNAQNKKSGAQVGHVNTFHILRTSNFLERSKVNFSKYLKGESLENIIEKLIHAKFQL